MNPELKSFSISSPITLHFSSLKRRRCRFTGFDPSLIFNLRSATSLGIPFSL
jgi:hypothetical protein